MYSYAALGTRMPPARGCRRLPAEAIRALTSAIGRCVPIRSPSTTSWRSGGFTTTRAAGRRPATTRGFSHDLDYCFSHTDCQRDASFVAGINQAFAALPAKLDAAYDAIRRNKRKHATVIVLGYLRLFPTIKSHQQCQIIHGHFGCGYEDFEQDWNLDPVRRRRHAQGVVSSEHAGAARVREPAGERYRQLPRAPQPRRPPARSQADPSFAHAAATLPDRSSLLTPGAAGRAGRASATSEASPPLATSST